MKLTYRPEIDGLRAIAVISVIFYHAQIIIYGYQPFGGGFIGVDIFFVISGYLITSLILKELLVTGSFSFINFYERRARRLLPALLAVMLVSLPFAWFYLLPSSFIDFSKSILYSLGFSSNFYFHYSGQLYGAESGLLKPFLHTWSLSVEEQYYILFPIILLFTFKYLRKYLIPIFILGFIISLGLAEWGSKNHRSFNFYILPTRGWELLAGSILAWLEIFKGRKSKNNLLNSILPTIGLILIFHSIIFFNDKMFHPSFYTLSPIIGVCLIIWFSHKDEIICKILSTKLFVIVGLISYSLYLWHYPILAFNRLILFSDNNFLKEIFLTILIIAISTLSYTYIEKPCRKKNNTKLFFLNLSILLLFLAIVNLIVIFSNGLNNRYENIYYKNIYDREILRDKSWFYVKEHNDQYFNNNRKKILIIGDSHSKDLYNTFIQNKNLFREFSFVRYGHDINNSFRFGPYSFTQSEIEEFTSSNLFIDADYILISDNICPQENCFVNLNSFIEILKKNQKEVILTSLSPTYKDQYNYKRFSKATLFDYILLNLNNIGYFETLIKKKNIDHSINKEISELINKSYFENRVKWYFEVNEKLKKIAEKNKIIFLNKEKYQCEQERQICYGVTPSGFKIHYDHAHYTLEGAKFFGKKISEINWLKIN
jgi:peptidoglycan/LPS O-acetylase OafA/YrhL